MKRAWELKRVLFTGDTCYPFHVIGVNHYETARGERGDISWSVPDLTHRDYDLKGATFEGVAKLSLTDER